MATLKEALGELDRESYVALLQKLIAESRHVQNNPPDLIPNEYLVARHVLDALRPCEPTLAIKHVSYAQGRSNLIVEYPGTVSGEILSFVGCHMDVVTADPTDWALKEIQLRFFRDFLAHAKEQEYEYATPSTMKPTQWSYPGGGVNQIPGECTITGDVRLCPFYSPKDVVKKLEEYVDGINANIENLDTRGPVSKYVLPDENIRGKITMTFDEDMTSGVACNLSSGGYRVLCKATEEVVGHVKPYSITGSLPLIRELQDEGYDVQISGYGVMDTYHARNEYCLLSDMCQGYRVLAIIISELERID